jgi:D-xylose transport system permease protein
MRGDIDLRQVAMWGALAFIWVGLELLTDGVFLSARNLYNLAVQSSVVGVMATGMVLVIVARHIDLSVGSLLAFTGMAIAVLQVQLLPVDAAWNWPATIVGGLLLGAALGAWQGYWIAYRGLPAFVVTLAGLLMFRGGAYLLASGQTVAPLDPTFQLLGGGLRGSIGATWSWLLGAGAIAAVLALRLRGRSERDRALELGSAALWIVGIVAFVAVMNGTTHPRTGIPRGIPVPVLILIAVVASMSLLSRATRFGRHVFAIGGNRSAAELSGIDVRRVELGVFVLMGVLCAIAAVLTTARLNAGTSSMGTLAELNVIAAAVIGGTSLSGGLGTIPGAILGAVVMQSLENGMVLLGVSSAVRQVAIGLILIAAVWLDTLYRRRHA